MSSFTVKCAVSDWSGLEIGSSPLCGLSEDLCIYLKIWLKVMFCINKEELLNQFFSDLFLPHRSLSDSLLHRRLQIACVFECLCLTCRTSAQNAVSIARAASCHRKAGLPVLRALLLYTVCTLWIILDSFQCQCQQFQHESDVYIHTQLILQYPCPGVRH